MVGEIKFDFFRTERAAYREVRGGNPWSGPGWDGGAAKARSRQVHSVTVVRKLATGGHSGASGVPIIPKVGRRRKL